MYDALLVLIGFGAGIGLSIWIDWRNDRLNRKGLPPSEIEAPP